MKKNKLKARHTIHHPAKHGIANQQRKREIKI